ncbi:MAG TPA: hypothetical protein VG326_09360 [Tepidisphaeraceae bacterium]|nr:hypothetical protein [Tepidisphaeraceae bacterium]
MRKKIHSVLLFLLIVTGAEVVHGVGASYWTQTNEDDFKAGTLENVVATNLGDLKLSRAVKTLLEEDPQISSVNVLAEAPDGSIYAGTGPHGVLLQIKDQKVSTLAAIDGAAAILSLVVQKDGALIIGTGGEAGRVLKIDKPGDKPHVLFQAEGVQYIWGLAQTPDGDLYAATGPHGQLFEIKSDGTKRTVLDTNEGNLLSLLSDGKDTLYLGTDPHGLVYRVNRKSGESFVLYNAAESEVSALALDKHGNLYAGTSEAKEEPNAGAPAEAEPEKEGRPEGGSTGVPIPSDRPKDPTPPGPVPNPNPGQPAPIPKTGASFQQRPDSSRARAHGLQLIRRRTAVAVNADRKNFWATESGAEGIGSAVRFAFATDVTDDKPAPTDAANKKRHPKPSPGNPNPAPPPGTPFPASQPAAATAPAHQPTVDTTAGAEPRAEGNAIYRIDPDGFVTEVFRQPVLILSMVENNGTLLAATGGAEGQVYQIKPAAEETLVLAKVDAKEIMCLMASRDGKVYMGTANVGTVASMSGGFAARGTYSSSILDATQISRFGKIHLHGALPTGTTLTLSTRSGNVKEADDKTWTKWSDEAPAAEFMQVMSPAARFLQYRLTFSSGDGKATPVVHDVSTAYQMPNLAPRIKAIKIATSTLGADLNADAEPTLRRVESARRQTIAWDASDPNNDTLIYSLYIRLIGEEGWILIKDKLTDTTYEWDTRTVADGRYEVKVIASDANANPAGMGKTASRVSDPLTVDNTPPVIGDIKSQQHGADMHIDLKVVDRTSTVAAVDYSVDSNKDWQFVLPTDQIYDSPEETVSFSIPGLKPGQHQVTLRATDSKGNQSFENLFISVRSPAAAAK